MIIKLQSTNPERLAKEKALKGTHGSLWEGEIE